MPYPMAKVRRLWTPEHSQPAHDDTWSETSSVPGKAGDFLHRGTPRALLHRDRDVRVPDDVNLIAHLEHIEHIRIGDMSAIFPSVRTDKGDRRQILVDTIDGTRHHSPPPPHPHRAPRLFSLRPGSERARGIDHWLARLLQYCDDSVVVRRRHLVPDLELIEPLCALGDIDPHERGLVP